MKLYKLTDKNNYTFNDTLWGKNVSHSGTGEGDLCSPGWIHAYLSPELAVLLNPSHVGFSNPKLWEAEGEVSLNDNGLKVGCKTLTTIRQIPLPEFTINQIIAFGIYCALEVYKEESFVAWAEGWLSGKDRSKKAANTAWVTARSAAADYAASADYAADYAASAADYAAKSAASAAKSAAYAAKYAASASYASYAADYAASAAYWSAKIIDLQALAIKVYNFKRNIKTFYLKEKDETL